MSKCLCCGSVNLIIWRKVVTFQPGWKTNGSRTLPDQHRFSLYSVAQFGKVCDLTLSWWKSLTLVAQCGSLHTDSGEVFLTHDLFTFLQFGCRHYFFCTRHLIRCGWLPRLRIVCHSLFPLDSCSFLKALLRDFFSFPPYPDRHCGPPSLLFNGYRGPASEASN